MLKKIAIAILAIVGVVILSNLIWLDYMHFKDKPVLGESSSAVAVDSLMEESLLFTDVTQVLEDHRTFENVTYYDSVYLSMPEDILINVASVVIRRNGSASIQDVVKEFLTNRQVYELLPQPPAPITPPVPEQTRADTTTTVADTVINGQPYKRI